MKRILHLTLKKKWFDLIKSGEKKEEYREIKSYWERRFFIDDEWGKRIKLFDVIHFNNGYSQNCPFMEVEWKGLDLGEFEGQEVFAIKLGKILELRE